MYIGILYIEKNFSTDSKIHDTNSHQYTSIEHQECYKELLFNSKLEFPIIIIELAFSNICKLFREHVHYTRNVFKFSAHVLKKNNEHLNQILCQILLYIPSNLTCDEFQILNRVSCLLLALNSNQCFLAF